jgi:hypothetical protein
VNPYEGVFGDPLVWLEGEVPWSWRAEDWLYHSPLGQPWRRYDSLAALYCTEQMSAAARLPYAQARPALEALLAQRTARTWAAPRAQRLAKLAASAVRPRGVMEADVALERVALALQDYKFARGRYPASLAELQETLGWTIPPDPFSGKAFLYRTHGAGFVVYSVGPDMKDDGGTPQAKEHSNTEAPGDLVWSSEWHAPPEKPITPPPPPTMPVTPSPGIPL